MRNCLLRPERGRLSLSNDEAYEVIMDVAAGKLDSVDDIAAILATATEPRS